MKAWHNRPALKQLRGKKDLVGCEIGTQWGHNAEYIMNLLSVRKLYLVDPYEPYEDGRKRIKSHQVKSFRLEAHRRMLKWKDNVVWLYKRSDIAYKYVSDGELDFVYFDGLHFYEAVKKDLNLWIPKVKVGGLIAGHDYNLVGVRDAVNEEFGKRVEKGLCRQVKKKRTYDWWVWKE